MQFETQCLHAGYQPKFGEPRVQPIVQSTTFTYNSAEDIGDLFDLKKAGFFYTRLANPTTNAAEEKLTALEGGVGALLSTALLNILMDTPLLWEASLLMVEILIGTTASSLHLPSRMILITA